MRQDIVVVDTSVWVDYLANRSNPQSRWLDANFTSTPIGLPDVVLCEVLQGIRNDAAFHATRRILLASTTAMSLTQDISLQAAQHYRRFRQQGITIRSTIDCLVATTCLTNGHALLHNDRDFDHFERDLGLNVIHPAAQDYA